MNMILMATVLMILTIPTDMLPVLMERTIEKIVESIIAREPACPIAREPDQTREPQRPLRPVL
jgi:hypothetical protein